MDEINFRTYLQGKKLSIRVVGDYISRCKKVEECEGDLDSHLNCDGGSNLLRKLTYSKKDAELSREPLHSIYIKGTKGYLSIYAGTQSYRSAVRSYFEFKKSKI